MYLTFVCTVLSIIYIGLGLAMMSDIATQCRKVNYSELKIRVVSPFVILGWPIIVLIAGVATICDGIFSFLKTTLTTIYKGK